MSGSADTPKRRNTRKSEDAGSLGDGIDFRAFCERAPNAIMVISGEGRYVYANQRMCEITGYTRDELLNMGVGELAPDADREQVRRNYKYLLETDCTESQRVLRRKDGSLLHVLAQTTVINDEHMFSTLRDITEQQAMEEKLDAALQRLQFHIERMPLGYIVWDIHFRVLEWNPAAEKIFGYSRAEVLGQWGPEFLVPSEALNHVWHIWDDLLHGDKSSHSLNANLRKDGSTLTCEWFNTPLLDSDGKVTGVASMVMDTTERDAMEAHIRTVQRIESLGVMAAGIAHDFNSSLMVMLGQNDLLRNVPKLPPKAIEYIDQISDAGLKARDLIKHLLAYVRTGRHNPQPTDVNVVVREAERFILSSIGRAHDLEFELQDDLPLIQADRSQLEQVILNLCVNAQQAMSGGGTIWIRTQCVELTQQQLATGFPGQPKAGSYVELVVSDSGCGIDRKTIHRIFDPFFSTKSNGHGLGLAAVLGVVRQHQAQIMVESTPGLGTTMRVCFPVDQKTNEIRINNDGNDRSIESS